MTDRYQQQSNVRAIGPLNLDVVLIQRAPVNGYPPVIHQATILAEAGLEVGILDGASRSIRPVKHEGIFYFRPLLGREEPPNVIGRVANHVSFLCAGALKQVTRTASIRVVFDPDAIALCGWVAGARLTVVHFHEAPERREGRKVRRWIARRVARRADLVVVPDEARARALMRRAGLTSRPVVVNNCPRRLSALPTGRLREMLSGAGRKSDWEYIVLFQGSIATKYCLREVVTSMRWWPKNAVFVCIGPDRKGLEPTLLRIGRRFGYVDRIIVLEEVPYNELFSLTVDADLMVTGVCSEEFKDQHNTGASNKRFEAMACGVPQVSNDEPSVEKLVEGTGGGICVDMSDPEDLGRSISSLLKDSVRRDRMGLAARQAHLGCYNYETQFEPIMRSLFDALR